MKKRILSFITALCICLSLLPTAVLADGAEGEDAVARVGETTYTDFYYAYGAAVGGRLPLVLLADWESSGSATVSDDVTIDLNGHAIDFAMTVTATLTLTNSSETAGSVKQDVTVSSGNLKIASDAKALTISKVIGSGGSVELTNQNATVTNLTLSAGSLAVSNGATISDLAISGGETTLYYGKFGKITTSVADSKLVDLLMEGYAFYDQNDTVVAANVATLSNVYVKNGHNCAFTSAGDAYQCACGRTGSQEPVKYLTASGTTAECATYTTVTGVNYNLFWNSGWYVVSGEATIYGEITLNENSDVHLILKDGASLTAKGISASGGSDYGDVSLSIYAQSTGSSMGKLTVTGFTSSDGTDGFGISILFGSRNDGSLTINGGDIDVTGGSVADPTDGEAIHGESAGIYVTGDITINGGKVKATGGAVTSTVGNNNYSYGLYAYQGSITISGATVTATGGAATDDSYGMSASWPLTIKNSTVTAQGGQAAGTSRGIYAGGGMAVTDSTVSGAGQLSGTRFADGYGMGIYVYGDLTVSGSTTSVSGTATTAAVTNPVDAGYSYYRNHLDGCYGVYVSNGNATVSGGATLSGTAGDVDITYVEYEYADYSYYSSYYAESYGILVKGQLTASGGSKVNGTAGDASIKLTPTAGSTSVRDGSFAGAYSNGIEVSGDASFDTATVTGTAGAADNGSWGIYTSGTLTIRNSTVTATGGSSAGNSKGIYVYTDMKVTDSTVIGAGQLSGTRFAGAGSTGIYVYGDLTVSGSTASVTGAATTAAVTSPVDAGYDDYGYHTDGCYGVNVRGSATVSGGATLSGTAGNVDITYIEYVKDTYAYYYYAESYGVTVIDLLTVSGGSTVSGAAGNASVTLKPAKGNASVTADGLTGAYSIGIYASLNVSGDTTSVIGTAGNATANTAGGRASAYSCGIYAEDYYEYDYDEHTMPRLADAVTITGGTVAVSSGTATVTGVTDPDDGYEEDCAFCVDQVKIWTWDATANGGNGSWVYSHWEDSKVTVSGGTVKGTDSDSVQACVRGDLIVTGTGKVVLTKESYVKGKKEGVTEADETPSVIYPVVTPSTGNTVTNPDGSTTTTTTDAATGSVTETTKTPSGVTGTTVTDKNGTVTDVSASVPASAVKDGQTAVLPVDAVKPADSENAQEIRVDVPGGGADIEIPVEGATSGTVVVIVNADGTETVISGTKRTENGVRVTLEKSAVIKVVENSKRFADVPASAYYADAVAWASARNITNGNGVDLFYPNENCTRAQIVTFLWRAAGCPEAKSASSFSDVPADAYYAEAVAWAVENGITDGIGGGKFGPELLCSREQFATILYRYAQSQGGGFTGAWMFQLDFEDLADVSDWALEGIAWCNMNGILQGYDGKLMPNDDCTRAQIVTMLYRYFGEQ